MDEEPLLPNTEEQPAVMSNEEINAELGTPSPQPLSETDVAEAPQFSTDPLDPLSRVEQGVEGIKPEQMIGSSQMMNRSASLDQTRRYKGIGAFEIIPKDAHVDTLRKNQSDPEAVEAFDMKYGKGAAARYLSLAKKEHIETLLKNRNDEEAVAAFNGMYGAGMANLYAILYSPKANVNERYQAAVQLTNIMNGVEEAPKPSLLGTIGESIFTGAANFVQETARSIGALDKNSPSYRQEGVGISDYPITEAIVTNLTQFIAGRAALGALMPARDLTVLGSFFREMGLGAVVDAFAFAPEDKLVGDAAKQLATALGIPEQDLTWLWSVNDFDTEWQRRGMRAVEGAALGAVIEPVLRGIAWGIKVARGQPKEAEKIAETIKAPTPTPAQTAPKAEVPLEAPRKPADALEAPPARADSTEANPSVRASNESTEPPSKTATREETIDDGLTPKSPEEKAVKALIDEPEPRASNPIQQIIDQIPDLTFTRNELGQLVTGLTDTSFKAVIRAIEPFIEQAIKVADTNASDLVSFFNRANTVDEVEKFAALMNATIKQITDEINVMKARVDGYEKAGNKAEAARVMKEEGTPLLNLKSKLDKVDSPMATMASQIMVRRQIELRLAAAVRVRVEPLRQAGVTDRQIVNMIADAVDSSGNKANRVDALVARRDEAFKIGDLKLVERLDDQIEKAMQELEKAARKDLDSMFNRVVKTFNDIYIPNLLSGLPTFILSVIGPPITYSLRNAGEILGMTVRKGPVFAFNQQRAKMLGIMAGIRAKRSMVKDVLDAIWNERSKVYGSEGFGLQESGFIRAENYGLDSSSKAGMAVNIAGKAIRSQTWPLSLMDESWGAVFSRAEIGAESAFNFQVNVAEQITNLKALIDGASGAEKASLQAELKALKANPTITVPVPKTETKVRDGVKVEITTNEDVTMTLKEFIDHRVRNSFDKDGNLIDPRISESTSALAFRDPFSSGLGKDVEAGFAKYPLLRTAQAVLRVPVNALVRSAEQIPLMQFVVKDPQSIHADLKGLNGPRRQIEAQGRVVIGTLITAAAWELAASGLTTGEEPQNKWQRNNAQSANDTRGYNVQLGDKWYSYTGGDPVSTIMKLFSNYHQSVRWYSMEDDFVEKWSKYHLISASYALAATLRDVPTFQLAKSVGDFITEWNRADDDPKAGTRALENAITRLASGLIPAPIRGVNQLIDPTRIDTAGGDLLDRLGKTFKAEFGFRDEVPRMYGLTGKPLTVPRSTRAIYGVFAPLDVDPMNREEYIFQSIDRIEVITGRAFSMAPTPPGFKDLDLRAYKSRIGNASVADTYFKVYGTIKDANGLTIEDHLYAHMISYGVTPIAIGNRKKDGPLTEAIASTIATYKKMAWEQTKILEGAPGTQLMEDISKEEIIGVKSRDPRFDPVIPMEFPGFAQ